MSWATIIAIIITLVLRFVQFMKFIVEYSNGSPREVLRAISWAAVRAGMVNEADAASHAIVDLVLFSYPVSAKKDDEEIFQYHERSN